MSVPLSLAFAIELLRAGGLLISVLHDKEAVNPRSRDWETYQPEETCSLWLMEIDGAWNRS